MEYHERPGVYADYEMSAAISYGRGGKTVAVAAAYTGTGVSTFTAPAQAETAFADAEQTKDLVTLLFLNGAGTVMTCPVGNGTAAEYGQAAKSLLEKKSAQLLICDSEAEDIQKAIAQAVSDAAESGNYCIGVLGMSQDATAQLSARAAALNCERIALMGGAAAAIWNPENAKGIYGAAAFAGLLAGEEDPARPVSGAVLKGLGSVSRNYSETEIDALVRGGVTVLEGLGQEVSVVRAVTTRTTTNGTADASWRELSTILIVDDVIPGVRDALRQRFTRKKNNVATRGAIRSQVAIELEDRVRREIIDSYSGITAEADSADPTVCNVTFNFTVTHGLGRIYLTAYISV